MHRVFDIVFIIELMYIFFKYVLYLVPVDFKMFNRFQSRL